MSGNVNNDVGEYLLELVRMWGRRRSAGLAAAAVVIIILSTQLVLHGELGNYMFYIYGSTGCPHCRALEDSLTKWFGSNCMYFCAVDQVNECAGRFLNFYQLIGVNPAVPLTFVVVNGTVRAVVVGEVRDKTFWESLLKLPESTNISFYYGGDLIGYLRVSNLTRFSMDYAPEYFSIMGSCNATSVPQTTTQPIYALVATLVGLALSDAINPCTIFIYVMLLIASALALSRRRGHLVAVGLAFTVAVFAGYYALGIGLTYVLRYVPTYILSLVAVGFGTWVTVSGALRRSRSLAKGSVLSLVSHAAASIPISFALGLLVTFTLLPCSAGPYVVFVGIASKYEPLTTYALLALYNLIFISPLLIILILMAVTMRYRGFHEFLLKHNNTLSVIAGAILIAIGIWLWFIK